jgi:hypothetical protein
MGIRDAFIRRLGQKHQISQELLPGFLVGIASGLLSRFVGAAPDVKQALRRRLMRGLAACPCARDYRPTWGHRHSPSEADKRSTDQ